jgi:hypothetical protein
MKARSERTNVAVLVVGKVVSIEPRAGCFGRITRTRKRLERSEQGLDHCSPGRCEKCPT